MTRLHHRFGAAIAAALFALAPLPALASTNVFTAHLSGREEVPTRDTHATAELKLVLNTDETQFQYRLNASNIENVTAAKIFLGAPGQVGEEVATIYGPVPPGGGRKAGVLAEGMLTSANLTGSLAGHTLADLVTAMRAGNTYINITTDDGQGAPNEKPGDFSDGEIRGQIR
ncbi:MAG TPA: CHRD domain-containing protein [Candidatus Eisenbacteria bacterium]